MQETYLTVTFSIGSMKFCELERSAKILQFSIKIQINNPNLTNSLESLSHRPPVADLSISVIIFTEIALWKSRMLSRFQLGAFLPPDILAIHLLSKLRYLIHEFYLTNHLSFQKIPNYGAHYHLLLSPNAIFLVFLCQEFVIGPKAFPRQYRLKNRASSFNLFCF